MPETHETADDGTRTLRVTWADPAETLKRAMAIPPESLLDAAVSGELPMAPVGVVLGFGVERAEKGSVAMRFDPQEQHCNLLGVVAGGVTAAVLDAAMWLAVQGTSPQGPFFSTSDLNLHFIRPLRAGAGVVFAEADAIHVGRTTATAEARLVGEDGTLYAHATTGLVVTTGGDD
jgi:uncharacterized protein (TIGR00369 family)